MRKIAVVAVFAILAAMVPASVATAQPTPGSLDGVGTLMIINEGTAGALDLWIRIDGTFQKQDLAAPSQNEFQLPQGDHAFRVCGGSSTDSNCTGGAIGSTQGNIHVGSNDIINFLVTANTALAGTDWVFDTQMPTEKTETDKAQLTIVDGIGIAIDVCVGDNHTQHFAAGALAAQTAEFDAKDGEGQDFKVWTTPPAPAFTTCAVVPVAKDLGFPAGSNTVINLTINANCTSDCGYQIFPGEEPPSTSQQVQAFCDVVLQSANITPWLQALFDEVEVGNEDTYPSSDHVEKVITQIAELLEKGNQTAPADIRPAWLKATASFVETGRLAAVQYDISALPQDDLRRLIDGVEHPGADDSEEAANTAALTAWVTANCFGTTAITAEPSFTG